MTTTPLLASVKDTRALLGLSHQTVYDLINAGEVESVRIGGRRLIVRASIDALIERSKTKTAA
ncbi:helix-turn-helix domain-containing protein [Magnetospirillum molischianum]|uniref:Putative excisionase n=1 Tax=Magnetospirillum molischianum DSM 120 TaxID=1150626 RepID=H8FR89_MAGML